MIMIIRGLCWKQSRIEWQTSSIIASRSFTHLRILRVSTHREGFIFTAEILTLTITLEDRRWKLVDFRHLTTSVLITSQEHCALFIRIPRLFS
ncbi:hypothetical protein KQX54_021467 [Cotesia glomerata]|uniref:Uncharacterized protein n=1 Tax=Cotesia glomerata TaxID=32391 RepID=A0AAV7J6X2_COTGL|nr:hypothetical protein KQX54_021467 [Cotesia glomerata]